MQVRMRLINAYNATRSRSDDHGSQNQNLLNPRSAVRQWYVSSTCFGCDGHRKVVVVILLGIHILYFWKDLSYQTFDFVILSTIAALECHKVSCQHLRVHTAWAIWRIKRYFRP